MRKKVSRILNYTITDEDGFKKAFDKLEKEGRVTQKVLIKIIILLLEDAERREDR